MVNSTLINSFDKTKFLFHSPTDTVPQFLWKPENRYLSIYLCFHSFVYSVGEPINAEAWHWYNDIVGEKRCVVVDTWWQTGES
mgnify:CR=1 FL=1